MRVCLVVPFCALLYLDDSFTSMLSLKRRFSPSWHFTLQPSADDPSRTASIKIMESDEEQCAVHGDLTAHSCVCHHSHLNRSSGKSRRMMREHITLFVSVHSVSVFAFLSLSLPLHDPSMYTSPSDMYSSTDVQA